MKIESSGKNRSNNGNSMEEIARRKNRSWRRERRDGKWRGEIDTNCRRLNITSGGQSKTVTRDEEGREELEELGESCRD